MTTIGKSRTLEWHDSSEKEVPAENSRWNKYNLKPDSYYHVIKEYDIKVISRQTNNFYKTLGPLLILLAFGLIVINSTLHNFIVDIIILVSISSGLVISFLYIYIVLLMYLDGQTYWINWRLDKKKYQVHESKTFIKIDKPQEKEKE